jgi:hypothetical protein
MGAAKVIFKTQDRSATTQSLSGIYAGLVVRSSKGRVKTPTLITSIDQYVAEYGEPDLRYPENQAAVQILGSTDKLWVVRAAAEDIKYGGVLVRGGDFDIGNLYDDDVKKVIEPIEDGLTQDDLDSYIFQQQEGDIQVSPMLDSIGGAVVNSYEFILDGTPKSLIAGNRIVMSTESYAPLTDYNVSTFGIKIVDVLGVEKRDGFQRIIFDVDADGNQTTISITKGMKVKNKSNGAIAYVLVDAKESPFVIVNTADEFHDGDEIVVLDENDEETDDTATQKLKDEVSLYFVSTKQPVTLSSDMNIYKLEKVSKWETLYSFMITGINQGIWNNELEIGIEKSKDYDNCFIVVVYQNGIEIERHEVSKDRNFVDGFGNKLYIETIINNKSGNIRVKDNPFAIRQDGSTISPRPTDSSIWKRNAEEIFRPAVDTDGNELQTQELLLEGDVEVYMKTTDGLDIGDKIKFLPSYDANDVCYGTEYFENYTIENIDRDNNRVFLDRTIITQYSYNDITSTGWRIFKFQKYETKIEQHIIEGIQYFPYTIVGYSLTGDKINEVIKLGEFYGKVLDAGVNFMESGFDGSNVSLADMIFALRTLSNNTNTPVQLLLDGGFAIPAYAQEMLRVANAQGENNTHCYWSMDPAAEESFYAYEAVTAYADQLMINTHLGSLFSGWVKQYCPYNKEFVWTDPATYGAISQNYVHRNYTLFTPAAGLVKGKVLGLEIKHQFSEGELDGIVDARVNPIIYQKGQGLIIWGNRTMYAKPSPLQLRSVAFLLMSIRFGLASYLKYELFNYNNASTWSRVQTTINNFMTNEILAKEGVYAFKCVVAPTDSDIDNRRMPIFLGIQPTMDINEIPVTLAIFNKSLAITV